MQGGQRRTGRLFLPIPPRQKIFKIGPFGPGGDPTSITRTIAIAGITNSSGDRLTLNI
jgi:hypothetical protein